MREMYVAILCQWCSMWEHRICAGVSVNEYDVLSNSCNKIMFFCSVCCPKVSLALKLEEKLLTLECENIRKAISDLSAKIENLCSSEKIWKRLSKKLQPHCQQYNHIMLCQTLHVLWL